MKLTTFFSNLNADKKFFRFVKVYVEKKKENIETLLPNWNMIQLYSCENSTCKQNNVCDKHVYSLAYGFKSPLFRANFMFNQPLFCSSFLMQRANIVRVFSVHLDSPSWEITISLNSLTILLFFFCSKWWTIQMCHWQRLFVIWFKMKYSIKLWMELFVIDWHFLFEKRIISMIFLQFSI